MLEKTDRNRWRAVALCGALSVLLHGLAAWGLLSLPEQPQHQHKRTVRLVRLHRTLPSKEAQIPEPAAEQKEKPALPTSAKTDPDMPERLPERVDHVGKRNARAASDPDADRLRAPSEAPAMDGEEKEETATFDQEYQDGDIAHEGKRDEQPAPSSETSTAPEATGTAPSIVTPGVQEADTVHDQPEEENREGEPEGATADDAIFPSETEQQERKGEGVPKRTLTSLGIPSWDSIAPDLPPTNPTPAPPARPSAYRDPALADHMQPGFRTHERRSRSVGRFVMGKHASLNVAATPRGRYEEEVYRRIAYWWYRECDEHRGDIIPGKIVISIRINRKGRLVNMDLIQRSGASVIQQSFTFGAIRKSTLPPMPANVQEEIIGELLEIIIDFTFN